MNNISNLERRILRVLQAEFPLANNPYQIISKKLKSSAVDVFKSVQKLKNKGVIKKLDLVFDYHKLGYSSSLIALEVPKSKIKKIVKFINKFSGVTHNYLRQGRFNLWFTLIFKNLSAKNKILAALKKNGAKNCLDLPGLKTIKLDMASLL